ncbi:pimeloyl-ACP methyl esterase BioG family protein [Paracoccus simplex]|uniref:Pimeloyl-ACP methyl esterase BioG family protein n=1 Tax=Paracoccus simplex TaxID=2086346 RepID=A0ABV7S1V1_9RHOB
MRAEWLRRTGAEELIVVLTGWAVGSAPLRHLAGPADVLVLSDYRDLTPPDWPRGYAALDLVAWSFGVAAACHMPDLQGFRRKVAVCGSWAPCDDALGIPCDRMRATAANLSAASLRQFARRAGCPVDPGADLAALRQELEAVMARDSGRDPGFDRIWLGAADRIFPLQNLRRAWRDGPVATLDCGHNPFAQWRDWDGVLA